MSVATPDVLIKRYRKKGLLLDSNLLLLLFVGELNPELISSFKRTSQFKIDDFELLKSVTTRFERLVTTPHILTEVSNLSKLKDQTKLEYFKQFGERVLKFDEHYAATKGFCLENYFGKFGITDAAIIHASSSKYLILTAEFPLANYLQKERIDAINFHHLRHASWNEFSIAD